MKKKIENYTFKEQLGSGAYSKVYRAVNAINNQEVAIKMVPAQKIRQNPKLEQGLVNEIHILTHLEPSQHIIRYYDMLKTTNNFYFIYQFCNGGTLQKLLRNAGALPQKTALIYYAQIIKAFKILTQNNIMHRDLKPQNIFIHNGVLKLGDFGFCKHLSNAEEMLRTMLGSPIYMAPEILNGDTYTNKADIWSLGVILYRMVYGRCPFEAASIGKLIQLQRNIEIKLPSEPKTSKLVEQLLSGMLVKNQRDRLQWKQVFQYEISDEGQIFFVGNKSQKMASSTNSFNSNGALYSSMNTLEQQSPFEKGKFSSANEYYKADSKNRDNLMERSAQVRAYNDKSPEKGGGGKIKLEQHLKNHNKLCQINSMASRLVRYDTFQSLKLSLILQKYLERDLGGILKAVLKQLKGRSSVPEDKQFIYKELKNALQEQVKAAKDCLEAIVSEIATFGEVEPLQELQKDKTITLKKFVGSLNMQNLEQMILVSQLIDYIEQNILIQKGTFEKMSKEHLKKQVKTKVSKLLY